MSTKYVPGSRPRRVPALQGLPYAHVPKGLESFLQNVYQIVRSREGEGDILDRVLTVGDLVSSGLATYRADGSTYQGTGNDQIVSSASRPYLATPPKITNLAAAGTMTSVILTWDYPEYSNHSYAKIYRADSDSLTDAAYIGNSAYRGTIYVDYVGNAGTYYYWIKAVSLAGVEGPYNANAGTAGTAQQVQTDDVYDSAITADKIFAGAVTLPKFGSGLTPVEIVSSLPVTNLYEGRHVYLTTDQKLYRYDGDDWTTAVAAVDLSGQITTDQIGDSAVTTIKIAGGAVTVTELGDGSVTEIKLGNGSVTSTKIGDSQVIEAKINDAAVTVNKIGSGAVTEVKLGTGSVTVNKIGDLAVSEAKIAAGAVTVTKIGDTAVTEAKLDTASVTATKIGTGAVIEAKLAAGSVTVTKIGDLAVTKAKFYTGLTPVEKVNSLPSLPDSDYPEGIVVYLTTDSKLYRSGAGDAWTKETDGADIKSNSITAAAITAGTITTTEIAATTILAANIAAGTITTTEIAANTIVAGNIAAGTITGTEIAATTIAAANIVAGTITTAEIAANTIVAGNIAAGTITGTEIAATTIAAANIVAGTITTAEIAANTIVAGNIAAGTITTDEIAANTIVAGNIAAGTITTNEIAANTIVAGNIEAGAIGTDELLADSITTEKLYIGAVTAEKIAANAVVSDAIIAGAVTADKISVVNLAALSADLGTVTAGLIQSADETFEISLASKYIIIAGPSGVSADSYMKATGGELEFYKWTGSTHILHKAVKHREQGTADSGDTVQIPGYFDSQPSIVITPLSVMVYDATYTAQDQTLQCIAENINEYATGQWEFDAVANLTLSGNTGNTTVNETSGSQSSDSWTSSMETTPANCTDIVARVKFKSTRGTGTAPNYYYRKVNWRIGYRTTGGGSYTYTSYQEKELGATFDYVSDQRSLEFPGGADTYDIIIEYVSADAGGTFASGDTYYYNTDYQYASLTSTASVYLSHYPCAGVGDSDSVSLNFGGYSPPSGYTVYQVDYSYQYAWHTYVYCRYTSSLHCTPDTYDLGKITTPKGTVKQSYIINDYGTDETGSAALTNWTSEGFTQGSYSQYLTMTAYAEQNDVNYVTNPAIAQAEGRMQNGAATIHSRKPVPNSSTADNTFDFLNYDYEVSGATVLASGSLNWSAFGE